jgi:hypothetical protein
VDGQRMKRVPTGPFLLEQVAPSSASLRSNQARLSRIGAATAPIDTEHQHGQPEELARAGVGDVMKHQRDHAPADNKHDDKKGGQSDQRQPERTQKSMGFHESEQTALARATCAQ